MRGALVAFLFSCAPQERALVVAEIPPAPAAPAVLPAITPAPSRCTYAVTLRTLKPETSTCKVFGLAASDEGTLEMPCDGSGPATLTFARYAFAGTSTQGTLHLVSEHSEEIGDGCGWRFFQEIDGTPATLRFTYHEEITLDQGHCYRPCGAKGDLQSQRAHM